MMKFRVPFTLILLASLLIALLGLARVPSAYAAQTLTVTDCSSDSQLQADVTTANSESGDTINFNCSGDITLTSTLTVSGSMTLDGSGQSVTLDGQNQVQVLKVNSGVTFNLNTLTIARGLGSGIVNSPCCSGGGLFNSGTANITNSTFAYNSAPGGAPQGGGLFNNGGTVSITNSTFANNSVSSYNGAGGGLFTSGGTVSITNSTFANNSARFGGAFFGGGAVSITNSTFANNSAGYGSALFSGSTVSISGSILANNGGNCINGLNDQGYNLSNDGSCGFGGTGDLQNTDPQLDPNGLQNNGGPTQTIALLATSPAIDHIPAAHCPTNDQRGVTRLPGERCDIGAFEFPDTTAPTLQLPSPISTKATSPAGATVTYSATATDDDGDSLTATCSPASGSTFPIGTTMVNCSASEPGSNTASGSFQVTVNPVLTASETSVSFVEGSAFSGPVATGTDYGAGMLSATINWGDGNSSPGSVNLNADGSYSVTGSHTYAEEGSFTLSVQVSASGGQSFTVTGSAAVVDAPLTITKLVVGADEKRLAGLAATFTDADPAGTVSDYSATISWGDGATSTGLVVKNPLGAGFVVAGSHQYAKAGTYTVTVTIHDSGGGNITGTQTLVVP